MPIHFNPNFDENLQRKALRTTPLRAKAFTTQNLHQYRRNQPPLKPTKFSKLLLKTDRRHQLITKFQPCLA